MLKGDEAQAEWLVDEFGLGKDEAALLREYIKQHRVIKTRHALVRVGRELEKGEDEQLSNIQRLKTANDGMEQIVAKVGEASSALQSACTMFLKEND